MTTDLFISFKRVLNKEKLLLMMMWKQREVILGRTRHPNNVNVTKPLMDPAKIFAFNMSAH